jgi:protein TonB
MAMAASRSADQEADLEARIRDAVQAAVRYPAAARMMRISGRARVQLDYRSGGVESPMLAQSSGAPLLDEAALAAARGARYPMAPPAIEGRLLRLLVWVEFKPG